MPTDTTIGAACDDAFHMPRTDSNFNAKGKGKKKLEKNPNTEKDET
jgi:hypothetical protein